MATSTTNAWFPPNWELSSLYTAKNLGLSREGAFLLSYLCSSWSNGGDSTFNVIALQEDESAWPQKFHFLPQDSAKALVFPTHSCKTLTDTIGMDSTLHRNQVPIPKMPETIVFMLQKFCITTIVWNTKFWDHGCVRSNRKVETSPKGWRKVVLNQSGSIQTKPHWIAQTKKICKRTGLSYLAVSIVDQYSKLLNGKHGLARSTGSAWFGSNYGLD